MLRDRLFKGYVSSWMPVALFLLLTGMFWIGDRSLYHKLYYITVSYTHLDVYKRQLQDRWCSHGGTRRARWPAAGGQALQREELAALAQALLATLSLIHI